MPTIERAALASLLLLLAAPGCTDEGEPSTGSAGSGATEGTGAAGGGGASTGGTGGSISTGGTGGGIPATCLPDSAYTELFTLEADDLCALAVYTADGSISYQQPTWGAHGGPLLVAGGAPGEVTLSRWAPPQATEGAMTIASTSVDASIPAGAFVAGVAADLGFRPGTAVAYSGAFPDTAGELIVIDGMKSDERYPVNGLFSLAVLAEGSSGRVAYSGLSPVGDNGAGANGLYAADDCDGTFDPGGNAQCKASIAVAAWGDASGPVVSDAQGNVFTVMTSFAGDQEGRAYAASTIAKGAAAAAGDTIFTLPGFGVSLAAIAPEGSAQGIVAYQPADGGTFEALDVVQVRYTVSGGKVTPSGDPTAFLTLPEANTSVALLTDPEGRLWVGVPKGTGTTFVVLGRKPQ